MQARKTCSTIANTGGGVHGNPYGDVSVYTYPQGKLVGILKGFNRPNGMGIDKPGDVFVANFVGRLSSSTRTAGRR